jgi:hypothetical protein
LNVISKYRAGEARGVDTFAAPAFGFCSRAPPAAVASLVTAHPPPTTAFIA